MEQRRSINPIIVMIVLALLIFVTFMISINSGYSSLSPADVLKTVIGAGSDKQNLILFDFRLPRILIASFIGAGLAVSGAILQGVSQNSLADPGILGINSGAGIAVVLFLSFISSEDAAPVLLMPFVALLGAGITAAVIFALAYKKGKGVIPIRLLLVGIAVGAGISAALLILTTRMDQGKFEYATIWLAGSIWGTNWTFVLALLPWVLILIPFAIFKARILNILNLGEKTAMGLGASVQRERFILIGAAVGLAGACVAIGGGIGFLGLIGPHLARRLVGPKYELLLPASALVGALLLLSADIFARILLQPTEIPTGIVVSVMGAPYFLYLLSKSKG